MLLQYKTTYDDDGGTETLWVPDLEHVYEDEIAALRAANAMNADPDIPMFYCTQEFEIRTSRGDGKTLPMMNVRARTVLTEPS